jgi:heme/copper-type cytochrome/quinol oxidase subunit 3
MENKTMIKLVVGTEAMFFLALIMAFIYLSFIAGFKHGEQQALNIQSTGMFSILLVSSSLTFWLAEKNYKKGNIKQLKTWLFITIILGSVFLFGQAKEYIHLIHVQQITLSNSIFGTGFYTLTGFHGFHVIVGLILLITLLVMAMMGDFNKPGSSVLSTAGIYWHFVDIVWIVVFTVVYVLPRTTILN